MRTCLCHGWMDADRCWGVVSPTQTPPVSAGGRFSSYFFFCLLVFFLVMGVFEVCTPHSPLRALDGGLAPHPQRPHEHGGAALPSARRRRHGGAGRPRPGPAPFALRRLRLMAACLPAPHGSEPFVLNLFSS